MEGYTKICASVVFNKGITHNEVQDFIYLDGRVRTKGDTDRLEVTLEKNIEECVFAFDREVPDDAENKKGTVSVLKELIKFHNKTAGDGISLEGKLDQFKECIEVANNLTYSLNLNNPDNKKEYTSLSALVISDHKVAALNIGKSRIYSLRNGKIKHMTADYSKAERLMKFGIVGEEQADELSKHCGLFNEQGTLQVNVSEIYSIEEGDVFLICSDNVGCVLEDTVLEGKLSSKGDTAVIANEIIKEAILKGGTGDLTVLVIRAEELFGGVGLGAIRSMGINKPGGRQSGKQTPKIPKNNKPKNETLQTLIAAVSVFVVIIVIMIAAYKMVSTGYDDESLIFPSSSTQSTVADNDSSSSAKETQPSKKSTADSSTSESSNTGSTGKNSGNTASVSENNSNTGSTSKNNSNTSSTSGNNKTSSTNTKSDSVNEPVTYTVQPGDTLSTISKKFYKDTQKYNKIMEYNNITDENKIHEGQVLKIPQ